MPSPRRAQARRADRDRCSRGEDPRTSGRAAGVVTRTGASSTRARSPPTYIPQLLLTKLLDRDDLNDDQRRIDAYRSHSATFRMNVALSELPRFSSLPPDEDLSTSRAPSSCARPWSYMQRAYREARDTGWTRNPIISLQIPSTQDDTLAPARRPRRQPVLPALPARTAGWPELGRREGRPPPTRSSMPSTPTRRTSGPRGRPADQVAAGYRARPEHGRRRHLSTAPCTWTSSIPCARFPGLADHRMPTRGVYLCGSGAHPGGGVSGLPGTTRRR
jgi:phytoene dehydrogenase-like protein